MQTATNTPWNINTETGLTLLNRDKNSIDSTIWNQLNKKSSTIFSIKSAIFKILIKKKETKEIKTNGINIFKKLDNISNLKTNK